MFYRGKVTWTGRGGVGAKRIYRSVIGAENVLELRVMRGYVGYVSALCSCSLHPYGIMQLHEINQADYQVSHA